MGLLANFLGDQGSRVVRVYCQLEDGSIWEGNAACLSCHNYGKPNMEIRANYSSFSLFHTDVSIENFDSVKKIKELLESNPDDFLEKIIDPKTYKPTELGAKIIRNINPNEDDAQKLYKSFKTIEKNVAWFDPSKILKFGEIDGDPATIVTAFFKDAIKGEIKNVTTGSDSWPKFVFSHGTPKKFGTLLKSIFEGYCDKQLSWDGYGGDANSIMRNKIIKIIGFFVTLSNLLED